MTKRVALYARVSYDDRGNEARNLEGQIEDGREYAQGKGYQVVAELAEGHRGASGADWGLPMLNHALDMARENAFDVLVTRELDRFARGLAKQLVIEGEFKRYGMVVGYVLGQYDDTPEGRLNKHIRATIADFAKEVAEGLDKAEENFDARRRVIDLFNVQVTLTIEDGQRVIRARCYIGEESLPIARTTPRTGQPPAPTAWCPAAFPGCAPRHRPGSPDLP